MLVNNIAVDSAPVLPTGSEKTNAQILQELSGPEWKNSEVTETLKRFTQVQNNGRGLTILSQLESHLEKMVQNGNDNDISNTLIKIMQIYQNLIKDSSKEIEEVKLESYKIIEKFSRNIKDEKLFSELSAHLSRLTQKMPIEFVDKITRYLHPELYAE